MIDRGKLVELMKTPIYPRVGADPAEVVADFILDNENKIQKESKWVWHPIAPAGEIECGNCHRLKPHWVETSELKFCPMCGVKMKEM